jgi:hypothetical protein
MASQHQKSWEDGWSEESTNLDSVLGQHGAMQLDGRKRELLCDLGVLDLAGVVEGHTLDVLGDERGGGNGRSAT